MANDDRVMFQGYLPNIQSALKISGDGDTLRAQIEVPIRIYPDALKLMTMAGKRIWFEIWVDDDEQVLTELDDEAEKGTERKTVRVGRRRS